MGLAAEYLRRLGRPIGPHHCTGATVERYAMDKAGGAAKCMPLSTMNRIKALVDLYLCMVRDEDQIYSRMKSDENENVLSDCDAMLQENIGEIIVKYREPATVGVVRKWEHAELIRLGLMYLVERDASDYYDDITGYIDTIISDNMCREPVISSLPEDANGLALCEWIDKNFPV